jgi:hypothetical protein
MPFIYSFNIFIDPGYDFFEILVCGVLIYKARWNLMRNNKDSSKVAKNINNYG